MPRRDDVHLKSLYFAIWAAVGAFWPYIYVYYRSDIGLTGTQIGMVVMISSLLGMVNATAWGMLNDRLGRTRLLLSIQAWALIVVCLALSQIRSFAGILIAAGMFNIFASPIIPLLDSTTLNILGARRDHYGVYRAWGTIGFVVTCTAIGFVIERTGMRLIFPVYAAGVLAFWLLALRLPNRPVVRGPSRFAGLSQMVRRPAWLIFATSVFVLWFSVMGAFAFLGIVVVEMGGTQRMVGLAATIAALSEIPMFHYSSRLLRRFGPARLLIVAMSVYAFRLLLYAIMPSVTWVLGLAMLQGLSYGLFLVAAVAYVNDLAPDALKSTAQGLMVSVMSLANLTAGLAGGWLLDNSGRQGLFFSMMATSLLALGIFALGWASGRRRTQTRGLQTKSM